MNIREWADTHGEPYPCSMRQFEIEERRAEMISIRMFREYQKARQQAVSLIERIEFAIKDMPSEPEWDWASVEETQYLVSQLREISDRLYGEGEYADNG